MKNIIFVSLSLLIITSNLFANNEGKELFVAKCATCHSIGKPSVNVIAPPIRGVMFHLSEFFNPDGIRDHIADFVMDPTLEEAICKSVKRFGLMPSQKGLISQDELNKVIDYMMDDLQYNPSNNNKNKHGNY